MESRAHLQAPTQIDGSWAASDGAYTVTFRDGRFITRQIRTSALLAQGFYEVQGDKVGMRWVSRATGKRLHAICSFTSTSKARCVQGGIGGFNLTRLTGSPVGI